MKFDVANEQLAWELTQSLARILHVEPWGLAIAIVTYVEAMYVRSNKA